MSLEEKIKEKRRVIRRTLPEKVLDQIRAGKKFILVDGTFDPTNLPEGYMLIDVRYKGEGFKTVVPVSVMIYMANPGEGDLDDALDEISDFYEEVEEFEEGMIEDGDVSVQGTDWAVAARSSYRTYLVNKLTKPGENVDVPELNEDTLKSLDLNDEYIAQRVRAMAAAALGLSREEVKSYSVGEVLKHVTINERKVEMLTREEFDRITCWAGSHYEVKDEFKGVDGVTYEIEQSHDKGLKVGRRITKKQVCSVFDAKISSLEREIEEYRRKKHGGEVGRHDRNLIRAYTNLKFIAKEDPSAQLPLIPPVKENGE